MSAEPLKNANFMSNSAIYITGIAILMVYLRTLSPSIAGGDSGEIVAEGCELGTAHPPGYPIMTILVYVISGLNIPGTNVAIRVNCFSAICTTLASICMGFTVRRLSSSLLYDKQKITTSSSIDIIWAYGTATIGSIATMLLFSFSPLIWQYAVTAEVFPLNTLFAALLLYQTVCFSQERNFSQALQGAMLCGLALCNQHTIILYEVPLVLWMLFLMRRAIIATPVLLLYVSVGFILGFLPYLYLPFSELFNPQSGSWGHLTSFSGFLHHFLRKDYGTFQLFSGVTGKAVEGLWQRNAAYWDDALYIQGLGFVPYLAIFGSLVASVLSLRILDSFQGVHSDKAVKNLAQSSKKVNSTRQLAKMVSSNQTNSSRQTFEVKGEEENGSLVSEFECRFIGIILILMQLFYFGVFHSLSNLPLTEKLLYGVHQRFWMQPNVLLFIWMGVGFNGILSLILFISSRLAPSPFMRSSGNLGLIVGALGVVAIVSSRQIQTWYGKSDKSRATHFQDYASAILSPLPQNAILLLNYDQQWTSVRYMQVCEGFRTDVTSIHLSLMTFEWFQHKIPLFQQRNLTFPGHFAAHPKSPKINSTKAFTVQKFFDVNIPKHQMFIGGKLNLVDDEFGKVYDLVPVGLVSQIVPVLSIPNATYYKGITRESWKLVVDHIKGLPDERKYPEETWEWTIGRDFKDRVADTASYLLYTAIKSEDTAYKPLVDAVYWLETAILLEGLNSTASLLKNAGLAHVHMVQNKLMKEKKRLPKPSTDIFNTTATIDWPEVDNTWRDWSASRFMAYWNLFIQDPDAKKDPQYDTILKLLEQVKKNSEGRETVSTTESSEQNHVLKSAPQAL